MTDRRHVLKMLSGAAAGLCPTCLSVAGALASEKKATESHGAAKYAAPHWDYSDGANGPDNWGGLSPSNRVCGVGLQQSPIDLVKGLEASVGGMDISYGHSPLTVVNNGHTIQANCQPGNKIHLDGKAYKLLQFHFHHPSEHALAGKRFELEAHFVHLGDDGMLAVLGVFFRPGLHNASLQQVWEKMPEKAGEERPGASLSLATLLPEDPPYYRYLGSLTTPPCSEKVIWSVFAQPLEASTSQVQKFAKLFPMNARPLQPQNRRFLLKSS